MNRKTAVVKSKTELRHELILCVDAKIKEVCRCVAFSFRFDLLQASAFPQRRSFDPGALFRGSGILLRSNRCQISWGRRTFFRSFERQRFVLLKQGLEFCDFCILFGSFDLFQVWELCLFSLFVGEFAGRGVEVSLVVDHDDFFLLWLFERTKLLFRELRGSGVRGGQRGRIDWRRRRRIG